MSRFEPYDVSIVQNATGTGTAFPCAHFTDKHIQVSGIAGGCVLKVEGTIDGQHFVTASGGAGNITADGVVAVSEAFASLRLNRTTQGTGNPTAKFAGRNEQAS